MTTHKTLDIDPDVSAMLAKIEKKKKDHLLMLGEIVLESGIHKLLDGDRLKELLTRERDRLSGKSDPREDKPANASGTFPAKPAASPKINGHTEPEPGRSRAPDLLAVTAAE